MPEVLKVFALDDEKIQSDFYKFSSNSYNINTTDDQLVEMTTFTNSIDFLVNVNCSVDLCILDLDLKDPDADGFSVWRIVKEKCPKMLFIMRSASFTRLEDYNSLMPKEPKDNLLFMPDMLGRYSHLVNNPNMNYNEMLGGEFQYGKHVAAC